MNRAGIRLGCLGLLAGLGFMSATGCYRLKLHPVAGLRPMYPQVRLKQDAICPFGCPWLLDVPVVDSLQPTLRWEPYSRPDATYDLRIWRGETYGSQMFGSSIVPTELVYARNALPAPVHKVESPLEPSTLYFWTIRARFERDGQARVIDWAVLEREPPEIYAPRSAQVPHPGYYQFITPG